MGGPGPSSSIPLEIMAQGEFEPGYRLPLDIRGGERPVLPLSIYGAGRLLLLRWWRVVAGSGVCMPVERLVGVGGGGSLR